MLNYLRKFIINIKIIRTIGITLSKKVRSFGFYQALRPHIFVFMPVTCLLFLREIRFINQSIKFDIERRVIFDFWHFYINQRTVVRNMLLVYSNTKNKRTIKKWSRNSWLEIWSLLYSLRSLGCPKFGSSYWMIPWIPQNDMQTWHKFLLCEINRMRKKGRI